jgi:CBS-domain-containing membrane protein
MATLARDVMQSPVATVSPETPLIDVHRLFIDEEIHGAPVVNDDGAVVGVITTSDLIGATMDETESAAFDRRYLRELVEFSGPDWRGNGGPADFQDRLGQLSAADVMTPSAACVPGSTPVGELASMMHAQRIHRVWVTERGIIAGVVSAFDLLPLLAKADL